MMNVCVLVLCFLATLVRGQFLTDNNLEQFVPRSQVADKLPACESFRYVVVSQLVSGVLTDMVDRSKYMIEDHNIAKEMNCADGTLFSLRPEVCVCSVFVPDHQRFNRDRCVTISGDFQQSDIFQKDQRSGSTTIPGIAYIEDWDRVLLNLADNCKASNAGRYFTLPFFNGNSISRTNFDLQIQFYITDQSIGDSVYNIFSNGPCLNEDMDASFIVSYLRNAGTGVIVMGLVIRDGWDVRGNTETSLTYSCTINTISADSRTFVFRETDPTNKVRVVGSPGDPAGIQIIVSNSELESVGLGQQGVPLTGFCPSQVINTRFGLRRRLGRYIIAERNCNPFVGQAPANGRMCVGELRIRRDC